jgi:hypothetical protein
MVLLLSSIPLFIVIIGNGKNQLTSKDVYLFTASIFLLLLLTLPYLDLGNLIYSSFLTVWLNFLELQSHLYSNELSYLHIIMFPISMVMLSLSMYSSNKQAFLFRNILNLIKLAMKNPIKVFFIIMFLPILNLFFKVIGLYVIYNNTFYLFLTLLSRLAFVKLCICIVMFVINKDTEKLYNNFSLSFTNILLVFLSASISIEFLLPLVKTLFLESNTFNSLQTASVSGNDGEASGNSASVDNEYSDDEMDPFEY